MTEQNDTDARVKVSRAIKHVGMTIGEIRGILGYRPQKGNPYNLSVNSGFNVILERISALKKSYGHINSVFENIAQFYPQESKGKISAKITATRLAIEALQEYETILSNIKGSLNELPTKFFN